MPGDKGRAETAPKAPGHVAAMPRHNVSIESQIGLGEETFHLLVDNVRDYAIFMLDPKGNILTWNAGAERITGYPAPEAVGESLSLLYTPEDRDTGKAEGELAKALKEGRYEEEGWREKKDGARFWAHIIITPIIDSKGLLRGFAKVTRDISQRKHLIESEERFRLLVESVQDYAIFMLDPSGHVASWNKGAERIKGYTESEIVGRHFSIFYTPEDIASNHAEEELEIARREGRFEEEGWRVRKDGTRFWASVVLTAVFEQDGTLRGFAKITRDMTQRRQMETQLRDLNRQLESFAYSVSHDLRAPLRNVAFTSKMLLEDYAEKLDEEGKQLLEVQVSSATKLATVIDDLLTLSRISRSDLKREKIDVNYLAQEVWQDLSNKASEDSPPTLQVQPGITAYADRSLLRVIFLNLLDNAIKFSPHGGVVSIRQATNDGKSIYSVSDEGMGFDMEYAEKIFRPFERLVTDAHSSGSGIGLANVQQAVLRHGGKVWVESELGKGTTFYFTLS